MAIAAVFAVANEISDARAFEAEPRSDIRVRWDNTVKYSAAWRTSNAPEAHLANVNTDDGNRNFDPGFISNRVDFLSELDITYKKLGLRASGAAWYDTLYERQNNNDSPSSVNALSVPFNAFPDATRKLHGKRAEILDAFVFGSGTLGTMPASFRAGRHTLLWGESLLIFNNGISYAQAPLDAIKALSVPNSQAKELFMPVGQISGQLISTDNLTLAAYYQYDWRKTRLPASGSYFSTVDLLDSGGERLFTSPPRAFFRGRDLPASDAGQWGLSARFRSDMLDTDFGLYHIRFNEKTPQIYLRPGAGVDATVGKIGEYALVYPEDIRLIGASFSTNVGSASVAGEVHVRRNTPLVSTPQVVTSGVAADNRDNPLYAVGNTVHAQVSMIHILPKTPLWPTASLTAELGAQRLTGITRNPGAFSATADTTAWGLRATLTPTYFQVLPNLNINVPIGLGYNPKGRSPIAGFNGGADHGGDISIGIDAEYQKRWNASMRFTHYFGSESTQPFKGRDFIAVSIRQTF